MDDYARMAEAALHGAGDEKEFDVIACDGAEMFHLEKAFLQLGCSVSSRVEQLTLKVFKPGSLANN